MIEMATPEAVQLLTYGLDPSPDGHLPSLTSQTAR